MNPKNLDTIDSGSNYSFTEKLIPAGSEIARSAFNLSHLHTTTINNCGELLPIGLIETVPGDSFDLTVNSLVRVLPQVVPLYSRQRLYIHAFYSRAGDLWQNFNTFMTKGYSGRVVKEIPNITSTNAFAVTDTVGELGATAIKSDDLISYFGIPFKVPKEQGWEAVKYQDFQTTATKISLLPFMMYQRIYRDYYMNPNYYIGNEYWYPDYDGDFRLDDTGAVISNGETEDENHKIPGVAFNNMKVDLFKKRYRDYANDYFTSAVPFPQRGDTPTLQAGLGADIQQDLTMKILTQATFNTGTSVYGRGFYLGNRVTESGSAAITLNREDPLKMTGYTVNSNKEAVLQNTIDSTIGITKEDLTGVLSDLRTSITLNQLRELAVAQIELEKMARTDGSYKEFGLTFFNKVSKNAIDHRPEYIGGAYQSLVFSEVLQTSQTNTTEGNQSILGSYAGHGISASQDGYIGHVECDDYGYIMIIASIMPDVYYHQGISKMWTRSTQDDMYLPQRARLGLTHITNQELMWTKSTESNEGLYAYQTPYDELRYCANRISGKIADPEQLSFYPYTQARTFETVPTYSQSFAIANNVRKDYLAGDKAEVAYTAQFSLGIRAVRPIPYNPEPAQVLN